MTFAAAYEDARLNNLIERLKRSGFESGHLELSEAAGLHFASLYRNQPTGAISYEVFCGCSKLQPVAIAKALVENVERFAFHEGRSRGLSSCQTARSDGFAGYPTALTPRLIARWRCRQNALAEAVERYAWAVWWDDPTVAFTCRSLIDLTDFGRDVGAIISNMETHAPVQDILVIEPLLEPRRFSLRILLAKFQGGGYITGGAAGPTTKTGLASTTMRAAGELARHLLALARMAKNKIDTPTDYEEKLAFFGYGNGDTLVDRRLAATGSKPIRLPRLVIDEEVPHRLSNVVVVHRCLFADQPPFVAGAIDRLCI